MPLSHGDKLGPDEILLGSNEMLLHGGKSVWVPTKSYSARTKLYSVATKLYFAPTKSCSGRPNQCRLEPAAETREAGGEPTDSQWLLRTGTLLLLYPLMLLSGWGRLWIRERGQRGFLVLWQREGRAGLHRFGWAEAALDVEYAIASVLIVLAGTGVGLVLYSVGKLWFL